MVARPPLGPLDVARPSVENHRAEEGCAGDLLPSGQEAVSGFCCLLFRFADGHSETCRWRTVAFSRFMGWRGKKKELKLKSTEETEKSEKHRSEYRPLEKSSGWPQRASPAGVRGRLRKKKGVLVCTEDALLGLRLWASWKT